MDEIIEFMRYMITSNWDPGFFGDVQFLAHFFDFSSGGVHSGSLDFDVLLHNIGLGSIQENCFANFEEVALLQESINNTGLVTKDKSHIFAHGGG